jgi:hypothetical protein
MPHTQLSDYLLKVRLQQKLLPNVNDELPLGADPEYVAPPAVTKVRKPLEYVQVPVPE